MSDRFEIPHGDGVLYMHRITAGIKQKFVTWLRPRYILEAMAIEADAVKENAASPGTFTEDQIKLVQTNTMLARQEANAGALFWTSDPSSAVAAALMTHAGLLKMARLMFPDSMAGWTDAAIMAYLNANAALDCPYQIAYALAWETADPKAERPPGTSGAAPATTASGTTSGNPSSSA